MKPLYSARVFSYLCLKTPADIRGCPFLPMSSPRLNLPNKRDDLAWRFALDVFVMVAIEPIIKLCTVELG